MLIRRRT